MPSFGPLKARAKSGFRPLFPTITPSAIRLRLAPDDQQVRAATDHGGLRLERPRHSHEDLASGRIVPAIHEVRQHPPRSFDPVQALDLEAGVPDLPPKLVRSMKVRRGEVVEPVRRVLVMAVEQIALDDARERGVAERLVCQPIECRRPA
ncbi:MAG TPA: hypothetical protein VF041_11415 [Gemmatimonadaceae bacterium]